MALTPDEVERRTFPIADWGYERGEVHKFLVEVATTLRYAFHTSFPTVTVVSPTPPPAPVAVPTGEGTDLAGLGNQVDEVLRAASALGSSLRDQAEADATTIKAQAELDAADRLREAEAEAEARREQARRVLQAAEHQAAALLADAEQQAQDIVRGAVDQARARAERIERRAERHAERVQRFEADVHDRLTAARADLDKAIERLAGSADEPVLDLSTERPGVRIGSLIPGEPPAGSTVSVSDAVDPAARLMRAAVGRALDHATGRDQGTGPAAPALPIPGADVDVDQTAPAGS